jgi:hypothetical protein
MSQITDAQVERVQHRLQECYDGLPDEDKPVLEAVLVQAARSSEVEGFAAVVSGLHINVRPGSGPVGGLMIPILAHARGLGIEVDDGGQSNPPGAGIG